MKKIPVFPLILLGLAVVGIGLIVFAPFNTFTKVRKQIIRPVQSLQLHPDKLPQSVEMSERSKAASKPQAIPQVAESITPKETAAIADATTTIVNTVVDSIQRITGAIISIVAAVAGVRSLRKRQAKKEDGAVEKKPSRVKRTIKKILRKPAK